MIMANSRCTCSCPFHDSNGVLRQLKWTNHGGTLFVEELVTCQSRKRFSAETSTHGRRNQRCLFGSRGRIQTATRNGAQVVRRRNQSLCGCELRGELAI